MVEVGQLSVVWVVLAGLEEEAPLVVALSTYLEQQSSIQFGQAAHSEAACTVLVQAEAEELEAQVQGSVKSARAVVVKQMA